MAPASRQVALRRPPVRGSAAGSPVRPPSRAPVPKRRRRGRELGAPAVGRGLRGSPPLNRLPADAGGGPPAGARDRELLGRALVRARAARLRKANPPRGGLRGLAGRRDVLEPGGLSALRRPLEALLRRGELYRGGKAPRAK